MPSAVYAMSAKQDKTGRATDCKSMYFIGSGQAMIWIQPCTSTTSQISNTNLGFESLLLNYSSCRCHTRELPLYRLDLRANL